MLLGRDAGCHGLEQPRAGAGRHPALAVGLGALGADGVEVEQVGGRLRHHAHERPPLAGRQAARLDQCRCRARPTGCPGGPHRAGGQDPAALQGPEQRRLAAPVAPHDRGDLTGMQVEVDAADGQHVARVAHDDAASRQRDGRPGIRGAGSTNWSILPRRQGRGEAGAQVAGGTAGVTHRQRQRRPPGIPAELDDGGGDVAVDHEVGRQARAHLARR